MAQVLEIILNKVFSSSVKRCALIFKTSFSKSRRLCRYFAGIGAWVLENSAAHRAFLRKELNSWRLEESFSPKDTMLEEYIWIGTIAWGCCGTEVIWPWIHVSYWSVHTFQNSQFELTEVYRKQKTNGLENSKISIRLHN